MNDMSKAALALLAIGVLAVGVVIELTAGWWREHQKNKPLRDLERRLQNLRDEHNHYQRMLVGDPGMWDDLRDRVKAAEAEYLRLTGTAWPRSLVGAIESDKANRAVLFDKPPTEVLIAPHIH